MDDRVLCSGEPVLPKRRATSPGVRGNRSSDGTYHPLFAEVIKNRIKTLAKQLIKNRKIAQKAPLTSVGGAFCI